MSSDCVSGHDLGEIGTADSWPYIRGNAGADGGPAEPTGGTEERHHGPRSHRERGPLFSAEPAFRRRMRWLAIRPTPQGGARPHGGYAGGRDVTVVPNGRGLSRIIARSFTRADTTNAPDVRKITGASPEEGPTLVPRVVRLRCQVVALPSDPPDQRHGDPRNRGALTKHPQGGTSGVEDHAAPGPSARVERRRPASSTAVAARHSRREDRYAGKEDSRPTTPRPVASVHVTPAGLDRMTLSRGPDRESLA